VAGVGHLGDGGQEASRGRERGGEESGVQPLAELAPVLEVGIGDLLVAEHVPGRCRL